MLKEAYHKLIRDIAIRRSLNFTNVRKTKSKDAVAHVWDVENFNFTYAYSEATHTNFNLIENTQRNIKGSVAWQYNQSLKAFNPSRTLPEITLAATDQGFWF